MSMQQNNEKIGLVMEGGAMRGMFTAGVMDVLMENGIQFDGAVGVSAGAVFGCNYKSHQIGRVINYNSRFAKDKRYASMRSLLKTGDYYNAEFCYKEVPTKYDIFDTKTFKENPMEFFVVTTDIDKGKPEYVKLEKGDEKDILWMRASASMPLASNIVEIDGHRYLDGGIGDSIPLRFMESQGYKRNVVILTQPASYHKKPNKLMPILRAKYSNYPRLLDTLECRHHNYNEQVKFVQAEKRRNKVFVIQPKLPLDIGSIEHDQKELHRVYDIGRKQALSQLKDLKNFLNM